MKIATANDNGTQDAGVYTWELATNTVYADTAVADLFGLDSLETERGLPLEAYMSRVHAEDQPSLARAILEAIQSGLPFQASYRVQHAEGLYLPVIAYGKCFRDRQDEPILYSGVVFQPPVDGAAGNDLHWLCLAALDCAERVSRGDVAAILKEVLAKLAEQALRRGSNGQAR